MRRIGITTDCVCDLPEDLLKRSGVDLMYFYITTATGRFRDGFAISSTNLLEYLEEPGAMAKTSSPEPREYQGFFESHLKQYSEIVHIAFSSRVGHSCQNALQAVAAMGEAGKRVTVVDSRHLSTGMGHLVLAAVDLRDAGHSAREIAQAVEALRGKVSTTFITRDAAALYRSGMVSRRVHRLCSWFRLRPVLGLKDGRLTLCSFRFGSYEKAVMRYLRGQLKPGAAIDHRRLFITHAGCPVKMITQLRAEAERLYRFNEVIITRASATVSGNCGPETVGVLYVHQ